MRAAVVGAGPAGLYAARALLSRYPTAHVDILDRLPTPFGLIRYGVSPDHPHTKNAISQFSNFIQANLSRLSFFGNVPIGPNSPVSLDVLDSLYHLTVIATGALAPRTLHGVEIPPRGVFFAHSFAQWVNGHPELPESLREDLKKRVSTAESVFVIGVGNVAIDVARMLLRPVSDFADTDISPRAFSALKEANIKEVTLIGRKGPGQAAWTTAALREVMTKIPGIVTQCDHALVARDLLAQPSTAVKRMLALLKDRSVGEAAGEQSCCNKLLRLKFLRSPTRFGLSGEGKVLVKLQNNEDSSTEEHDVDTVFLSLGYESTKGVGYRVGWANAKATGIIGDNKWDAESVIAALPDVEDGSMRPGLLEWLQDNGQPFVSWDGWQRIDEEEKRRGCIHGRKGGRVKIESLSEMLQVARALPLS